MNNEIEQSDAQFKVNIEERIQKLEKECTSYDCKTVSMGIDRLKNDQREQETKMKALAGQLEHVKSQNFLMSKSNGGNYN